MDTKKVKKSTEKSEIQVTLMTQERADQLNSGGATQIVLNKRGPRYVPTQKETKKKE
jgi:hypothetical protein